METEAIVRALDTFHGNRRQAAQALGISERTLYRKMKENGLDR
jgi:DNA-binding NtrC family response regulator